MAEQKSIRSPDFESEKSKEGTEAVIHSSNKSSPVHHKEMHGTSDDIDKDTPIDEVKGPSVFERVKEEVEAVVGAVIGKK